MNIIDKNKAKFIKLYDSNKKLFALKLKEKEYDLLLKDYKELEDNLFYKKYYLNKKNIVIMGDTVNASLEVMYFICDFREIKTKRSYRCFMYNESAAHDRTGLIIHEDIKSSFNCFLEYMQFPDYLVIYYEKVI